MCLGTVLRKKPAKTGTGWKVFRRPLGLRRHFTGSFYGGSYLTGKWYKAELRQIEPDKGRTYTSGFHIFEKRKDAKIAADTFGEIVRRVQYRGAHTAGIGADGTMGGPQVVADEIKILPARRK